MIVCVCPTSPLFVAALRSSRSLFPCDILSLDPNPSPPLIKLPKHSAVPISYLSHALLSPYFLCYHILSPHLASVFLLPFSCPRILNPQSSVPVLYPQSLFYYLLSLFSLLLRAASLQPHHILHSRLYLLTFCNSSWFSSPVTPFRSPISLYLASSFHLLSCFSPSSIFLSLSIFSVYSRLHACFFLRSEMISRLLGIQLLFVICSPFSKMLMHAASQLCCSSSLSFLSSVPGISSMLLIFAVSFICCCPFNYPSFSSTVR